MDGWIDRAGGCGGWLGEGGVRVAEQGRGRGRGRGKGKGGGMVVRKHDLQPTKENCFSRYPGTTDTQKSTSMATSKTLCQASTP